MVSTDIYRPAGLKQLQTLIFCKKKILIFSDYTVNDPIDVVKNAVILAQLKYYDVLLIDTPGCLDTDHDLILELIDIYKIVTPIETLFIIDSMIEQVAVNSVKIFDKFFPFINWSYYNEIRWGCARGSGIIYYVSYSQTY